MKTVSVLLNFAVVAMAAVIVVGLLTATADTSAQTGYPPPDLPAGTPAAGSRRLYLPLITKEHPYKKYRSGVHFGSRDGFIYPTNYFSKIIANPSAGYRWPAVITVLSLSIYNFDRSNPGGTNPKCLVRGVTGVKNQTAFDYLKNAARNGSLIIIRIWPSPGNFVDALEPRLDHILLSGVGQTPGGANYCGRPEDRLPFRSVDDVALEIKHIHAYNQLNGLKEYAFEPANEPNSEWYPPDQDITLRDSRSWIQMDSYFVNLYNEVHPGGANPGIRVLTPPMAQFNWAEPKNYIDCSDTFFDENNFPGKSGYDLMPNTFGLNSPAKNDGYIWHNYWRRGKELWTGSSANSLACPSGYSGIPSSNHIVQFFPQWLRDKIATSPTPGIISEADLLSPCLDGGNLIADKDLQNGLLAAPSIRLFIQQSRAATFVAVWNLTNQYSDSVPCVARNTNHEFAWHEAYRENGTERPWFTQWWVNNE